MVKFTVRDEMAECVCDDCFYYGDNPEKQKVYVIDVQLGKTFRSSIKLCAKHFNEYIYALDKDE